MNCPTLTPFFSFPRPEPPTTKIVRVNNDNCLSPLSAHHFFQFVPVVVLKGCANYRRGRDGLDFLST